MGVADKLELMPVRDRSGVIIGEAFMIANSPQWPRVIDLVRAAGSGNCAASSQRSAIIKWIRAKSVVGASANLTVQP